jgi:hypothetical protein
MSTIGLFGVLIVMAAVPPFDEFFAADAEVEAGGVLETAVKDGESGSWRTGVSWGEFYASEPSWRHSG